MGFRRQPQCWNRRWRRLCALIWGVGAWVPWISAGPMPSSEAKPDQWVEGPTVYPPAVQIRGEAGVRPDWFRELNCDLLAGRLKAYWPTNLVGSEAKVEVFFSADEVGHWAARDWQGIPMNRAREGWEATVPVDHVDVPLIYFVRVSGVGRLTALGVSPAHVGGGAVEVVSPMRMARPRLLGLQEPTRIFWPFLEGFEEDLTHWSLLSEEGQGFSMKLSPESRTGLASLQVSLPVGKRSVTVATTRIRGWQVLQQEASGFRVWLRTKRGEAHVRFTLMSEAFTANQVVASGPKDFLLDDTWQKLDLSFYDFKGASLAQLDLLAVEFVGDAPQEFYLDDLQLLGPWPARE